MYEGQGGQHLAADCLEAGNAGAAVHHHIPSSPCMIRVQKSIAAEACCVVCSGSPVHFCYQVLWGIDMQRPLAIPSQGCDLH